MGYPINEKDPFVEFKGMEVSQSRVKGLGTAISQAAKEAGRFHQDRQRRLDHASGNSDRRCGGRSEKLEHLKAIKITVSPLVPQRNEINNGQKAVLRNYRAWAWGMNSGLIIKTGRGR